MDHKSAISIPMSPIDMSYIAHLIAEKTTESFASTEMVSSYDKVKKEKGEKHERKIECKTSDDKTKRLEITLSSEGKTQKVTLNDKEAYFLHDFIKFTVPRVTGWDTITRYSPPFIRRRNNINNYNNNNNNMGNEMSSNNNNQQQQPNRSNYRNNGGNRYNNRNNQNQGGYNNNNRRNNNRNNNNYGRNNNVDDLEGFEPQLGADVPDANIADFLVNQKVE